MILFKIVWAIDALVAAVILFFFVEGLGDGTVSSFNIGLWLVILAVLAVVMFGSIWLRSHKQPALALALLGFLAVPAILCGLFMILLLTSNARWN